MYAADHSPLNFDKSVFPLAPMNAGARCNIESASAEVKNVYALAVKVEKQTNSKPVNLCNEYIIVLFSRYCNRRFKFVTKL